MKNLIILLALSIPFALQAEVDCEALYRDQSALAEPLECTGFVPTVKKMNAPGAKDAVTDVANFFEMRNNDSFGTHQMGDLSNQTVGNPALAETYYAMEYEETGTTLYAVDSSTGNMVTLNPVDGTATVIGPVNALAGHTVSGITFDGNGNCYASSTDAVESALYSCNTATGAFTVIGTQTTTPLLIDISASCEGTVYGHDLSSDSFYTINTADGSATLLGSHGLAANFAQGMTYDREAGELYAYIYTGGGTNTYARVNQTNGSITALNVDNPLGEFTGASQTSCGVVDLSLVKTVSAPSPLYVGSQIVYTLTAESIGALPTTGVVVTDNLPAGLTYVSNTCGASVAGSVLTWNIGNMSGGQVLSCDVTMTVDVEGDFTNSASISSNETDTIPSNNSSQVTVTGQVPPVIPTLGFYGLLVLILTLGIFGKKFIKN